MQRLIVGLLLIGIAVLALVLYKNDMFGVLGMFGDKTQREVAQQGGYDYYYFAPILPSGTDIPLYQENGTYVAYIDFKSPIELEVNDTAPVSTTFPIKLAKIVDKSYDENEKAYIYKVKIELDEETDGFVGNRYFHLVAGAASNSVTTENNNTQMQNITKSFAEAGYNYIIEANWLSFPGGANYTTVINQNGIETSYSVSAPFDSYTTVTYSPATVTIYLPRGGQMVVRISRYLGQDINSLEGVDSIYIDTNDYEKVVIQLNEARDDSGGIKMNTDIGFSGVTLSPDLYSETGTPVFDFTITVVPRSG